MKLNSHNNIHFCILFVLIIGLKIRTAQTTDGQGCANIDEDNNNSECLPGLVYKTVKISNAEETCDSQDCKRSDDSYLPKKCKGEFADGRCFCYRQNATSKGLRIFGWSWWKDAENMTCACSRRRDELEVNRPDLSIHCSQNGNYEELQCDNGLCWCVQPETGKPTQRVYPESMMTFLPCYNKTQIGEQYLRQCESQQVARAEILSKLEKHGRHNAYINEVFCDGDGSYGAYEIVKRRAYCTWKDSSRLEIYQSETTGILSMNCNCARDTRIMQEENLDMLLSCIENGNYADLQMSNGRPYCVDSDGFATTDLGDFGGTCDCGIPSCSSATRSKIL